MTTLLQLGVDIRVFKIKGVPSKMLESHLKVYHIFLGKFMHYNWINNRLDSDLFPRLTFSLCNCRE